MTNETLSTTAPHAYVSRTTSDRSETRQCLIALGLALYTHPSPDSFTLLPPGQYAWLGVLFDGANPNIDENTSFVAFLSANDDSVFERNLTVSRLQDLAFEHGYRRCEVRNIFHGTSDYYETMFSGPIRENNAVDL